jgi:nucleotide-binding universal stress UspA family protein
MVSQVAAHATMPVMMVPATASMWSHRVIAIVEPHADAAAAVQIAARLAALASAPLQVIGLTDGDAGDAAQALARAAEIARQHGVEFEATQAAGVLDASLADPVRAGKADLLVLGEGGARFAHGRLSAAVEALVGAVECPTVLVGSHARSI